MAHLQIYQRWGHFSFDPTLYVKYWSFDKLFHDPAAMAHEIIVDAAH